MAENASKSIHNWINIATKFTKTCGSEFGALLSCHLTPQRKPQYGWITTGCCPHVDNSPKLSWKIYFLYDFWCAQTCSLWAIFELRYPCQVWQLLPVLCSDLWRKFIWVHIYVLGPKLLWWNFIKISPIYTKWGTQTFPLIFFAIFDCIFTKIVVLPSDETGQSLVLLKRQCLPQSGENSIKIDPINCDSNLVQSMSPSNEQHASRLAVWQTNKQTKTYKPHIFTPTIGICSSISTMVVECVETILKDGSHVAIQCIVFPTGCKMLIFSLRGDELPAVAA